MKLLAPLFGLALLATSSSPLLATLLVQETFDYTLDVNIGSVPATGTGLTGNWQREFNNTATATLRTYATTWTTPTDYGFSTINKGIGTPSNEVNSAAVNMAPAAQINFDADGTFFYSYLLNYSNGDDRSRVSFGSSSAPDLMRVQGIADGSLRVYAGTTFTQGGARGSGTFLVVGRIDTVASGNDTNTIWVYSSSDTVPVTPGIEYAAHSAAVTGTADMLQFSNVIDARYGMFSMGTTWESVTVPEPSSLALLALAAGGYALLRRRQKLS